MSANIYVWLAALSLILIGVMLAIVGDKARKEALPKGTMWGVRTRSSMASEEAYRRINRQVSGFNFAMSAIAEITAVVTIVLLILGTPIDTTVTVLGVGVVIMLVIGLVQIMYANTLT